MSTRAIIAFGGNLGDRVENISSALKYLASTEGVEVGKISSLYESHALTTSGVDESKPNYLNGVVEIFTELSAEELLKSLNQIERQLGRVRDQKWESRTVDLDIVVFGDLEQTSELLTIPHPRAHERAFVLVPWAEIDPLATLEGFGSVPLLADKVKSEVWVYEG